MLRQLPEVSDPNLLVGVSTGDDAAVYKLSARVALVQTVDFFPPIVDDPYTYGAIAAANALSDVYAMGATPMLALNIVGFPVSLPKEVLRRILKGGIEKAAEAGVLIVGGHTVDDEEPKYGLAVTGLVRPGKQVTNAGARPGDVLVLTKPIGTGIITTAGKEGRVPPKVLREAIRHMATLNHAAADAMVRVAVHAATDVTGFGLLGHLRPMLKASGATARITASAVPLLVGARALAERGIAPGDSPEPRVARPGRALGARGGRAHAGVAVRRADLGRAAHRGATAKVEAAGGRATRFRSGDGGGHRRGPDQGRAGQQADRGGVGGSASGDPIA